ncbi:TVP38/TMEM64 family protein [Candidatus Saccharibacteria bacterium]|nr:TVP38/TMEM64 family protein [Candidatus Saccharibacteria bacterium]
MQNKLPKLSHKQKIKYSIIGVIILALVGYIIWDIIAKGPVTQFFSDRDRMIATVNDLGPLAPLAYVLLQISQTVIAPIPGNLVGGIGGFLFGWWGVLWTTIGATVGATLVFWISRKFGRGFVEKYVKKESLDKFDFVLSSKRVSLLLFIIFLIPGLPDDIVCYLAGLTKVPLKKLVLIFAVGRLPAVIGNNYIGMGLGNGDYGLVAVLSVLAVLLLAVIYWQQDAIMSLLGRQYKTKDRGKIVRKAVQDFADDSKLNNSIAKKKKKS